MALILKINLIYTYRPQNRSFSRGDPINLELKISIFSPLT